MYLKVNTSWYNTEFQKLIQSMYMYTCSAVFSNYSNTAIISDSTKYFKGVDDEAQDYACQAGLPGPRCFGTECS